MKRFYLLLAFLYILVAYCVLETMDAKMYMREEAWKESVQALEFEQLRLQTEIEETRTILEKFEEQIHAHNLLIWDIRNRLHFDLELDLEEEKKTCY